MRIRTGYSFRTAVGHLPDVLARVQECRWGIAPISDRMSTFGFARWTKYAKEADLKPVYGVEIPCVYKLGDKKPITDHWTFFAKESLRPLHDLIYLATENNGRFATLEYAQAMAQEGVVVIAGERLQVDSLPPVHADFYVAMSPSTPKGLYRKAKAEGLRFLATGDNYYPRSEDKEFYRVTLGNRDAQSHTYPTYIVDDDELLAYLRDELDIDIGDIAEAFVNRDKAMESCNVEMQKAKLLVPDKPKSLEEMCKDGASIRGIDLDDPIYGERLEKELKVIHEKDFVDYFHILADMVSFAKTKMVVGPARGSSGGSLVCYLLGITAIDPIKYDLIFERFIDINRHDLPDIDVDFSDAKRHFVFEYAEQKYGKERVARLGTVGMFKGRSALNAAGTSLRIPQWKITKVAEQLVERSPGDTRALKTIEDTFSEVPVGQSLIKEHPEFAIAAKIEGHPQNASQHAAGLLLTDRPIMEFVAVDHRSKAAWCDKKDSEVLNLLKIDALGLTQLSIFERCLELIGKDNSYLYNIPLDDPKAFEPVNDRKYSGIFQLTGNAVRGLSDRIHFDSLSDLIDISAVARPGALDSGGAEEWVRRRMGLEAVPTHHHILDSITRDTYGVLIYQETVMRICRELAGLSWPDTSAIRKTIGDRKGQEALNKYGEMFVQGAMDNGQMSQFDAQHLWDQIVTFGRYGFNKSHAVAYGIISYWCCYLKAYHPVEFAAATLDAETSVDKQLAILRELDAEGIGYVPIDPECSAEKWTIAERDGKKVLVGPLTNVKGIGPAAMNEIINSRATNAPVKASIRKKLEAAKTEIDNLYPIEARIRELHPDVEGEFQFSCGIRRVGDIQPNSQFGPFIALAKIVTINPKNENSAEAVAKRGRKVVGPELAINMFVCDDSGEIFAKIDRKDYDRLAPEFLEKAKSGKSLYAIKGDCPRGFRMISIWNLKYLGEME